MIYYLHMTEDETKVEEIKKIYKETNQKLNELNEERLAIISAFIEHARKEEAAELEEKLHHK